ncbi:MAG: toprim domain-containing protein [Candidatus Bathyarchaeota archaeon]|nr:toprim domain-containing protein [Candidatus Bathyarchaeota archaeon]
MSTRLKEKEEKILKILDALAAESAKGTPVIVEGKKDAETLRALGIEGVVVTAKTGSKSLQGVVSEVERTGAREAILLLDFDRRGKEGTKRLQQDLEHAEIAPNVEFWRALKALLGHEIQCVESLTAYMTTLKAKIGAESQQNKPSLE